jgi:soluble lytic murein transglycosylase-like protein
MLFANEDKYNTEINRVVQEEGVPMSVLKGFFALESGFNARAFREEKYADPAKNDASYGLAQILYKTARGLGYTGQPDGLFDPYTSAKYGARFIKNLHKQYKTISDVIAAYNMGSPRKASAVLANPKMYSRIIGIYGMPTTEWVYANQPYVDRVSAYIAYYQAKERNDKALMAQIEDLFKKKLLVSPPGRWSSLIGEIVWP